MPEGSFFRSDLAFNGNGILISGNYDVCIQLDTSRHHDEEWVKEPGTGDQRWPHPDFQFNDEQIATFKLDPIYNYLKNNETIQKEFFWSSHTFTHENLDELHTSDVDNEIRLNIEMAKYLGLLDTEYWSTNSIITPQISGLHNKDALEVFLKYGIESATGDLSRNAITNLENPYLPFYTTMEGSNFEGFPIIPRTPTEIYYFCSTRDENVWKFNEVFHEYYGECDFGTILEHESKNTLLLLTKLRHEAYQFHQANLRHYEKGEYLGESLLEDWTRSVVNLYNKYVYWPLISLKVGKQGDVFMERAKLEACGQETKLIIENDKVVGVSVSATKGDCSVPITVPTTVKKSSLPSGATLEQVGKDPLTVWVPVKKGETKTIKFEQTIDWSVSGSEVTHVEPEYECMAESIGYKCCPEDSYVYYTDNYGDWGYDFDLEEWCGITPYYEVSEEDKCWSEKLGYKCCKSSCTVYTIDSDGKWGYEGDEWCGISSNCEINSEGNYVDN